MNKLISVVLAVFLFVVAIQASASSEDILRFVARSKGLPPLVARQDPGYGDATPTSSPADTPTTDSPLAKITDLPKVPGAVPPASPVDTGVKTTPGVSASPSASADTGTLIPQWSSLIASGGATPIGGQPTAPPALPSTTPKAATAVPNAADRLESGLIGVAIAGIVGLLF